HTSTRPHASLGDAAYRLHRHRQGGESHLRQRTHLAHRLAYGVDGRLAGRKPRLQNFVHGSARLLFHYLQTEPALQLVGAVAQSRARDRLPMTFDAEHLDALAQPVERKRRADTEVDVRGAVDL